MFEHSLIDLESRQQPRTRRWISLPVAVALHLVALAAFAIGSYWTVGTVPEPNLATVFIDLQLPPLPPPPAGGHPERPRTPAAPPAPHPATTPVQQPHNVPDRLPEPGPSPTVTDLPPGPPVVGTGFRTGPIGPGDGPDSGPTFDPGPREEGPIHLTAEMSRPRPLQPISPKYTEIARRAGLQGSVIVQAVIDEHGRATDVRILRGLPMGLDRSAVEAIERCPFEPARIGSRPVKVYFNLTVNFTIQR